MATPLVVPKAIAVPSVSVPAAAQADPVQLAGQLLSALQALVTQSNQITAYLNQQAPATVKPGGPQSVVATQLGGKIQLTWTNDESGPGISAYPIYRATAGTRNSPTSPVFSAALQVAVVPSQDLTCLPVGSVNTWVDDNFAVSDYKPDNPSRFAYWIASLSDANNFSEPVQAGSTPIELAMLGQGEVSPNPKTTSPNKLFNPGFTSDVAAVNLSPRKLINVLSTNAATPIEVTTVAAHGLSTTNRVAIYQCSDQVANGYWDSITVTSATKFTLAGSVGVAGGVNGFAVALYPGQMHPLPSFAGSEMSDGTPGWTPWYDSSTSAASAQFASDGAVRGTGEIFLPSPTAISQATIISQAMMTGRFTGGEHYTLSVYVRLAPFSSPLPSTNFAIQIFDPASGSIGSYISDGSLLTTTYQRIWATIVFGDMSGFSDASAVSIGFHNNRGAGAAGGGNDLYLRWPMLNAGDSPAVWTDVLDTSAGVGNNSSVPIYSGTPLYGRPQQGHSQIDATYV